MKGVKLGTVLLIFSRRRPQRQRLSHLCRLLLPFFMVQTFPCPVTVRYWIAERPAVRGEDATSVVEFFIVIVMTACASLVRRDSGLETRADGRKVGAEICTAMFFVAGCAANARRCMRRRDGCGKSVCLMARSAVRVHARLNRVAGRAGVTIGLPGNRRGQHQRLACVRA